MRRETGCMHAQRKAGSGEQRKRIEEQAASTDGSVSLSTVSLRKHSHLQLSRETLHFTAFGPIYHVPGKSFISGRQAFSAIPWISFAGFCQKSTQLHLCLSPIRALDLQMQYYGLGPARRAKQPAIRLHQRARLSAQQITFVLLQEIWRQILHCFVSSPVPLDLVSPQVPNSQALQAFDLDIAQGRMSGSYSWVSRLFSGLFPPPQLHLAISPN